MVGRRARSLASQLLLVIVAALVGLAFVTSGDSAASPCRKSRCDGKAPSTPRNLRITAKTDSAIALAWRASTDNVRVKGYYIFRGRTKVGTTSARTYTVGGLRCATSFKLAVRAFDAAGNRSRKASITASTNACPVVDTEPPPTIGASLPATLAASTGATFYVSTTGSDSNPGSAEAPWRTVQKALDTLGPGERALVRSGTYSEDLFMSRAGTAQDPITVTAYPGETAVLRPAATSGDTYAIIFSEAAYVRLQGFLIEGSTGTSAANVYVTGSSHHIEIAGNEIRYGQDQGFYADATTSHVYLLGNIVHSNGLTRVEGQHQNHGIYIKGAHDLIANNIIYNHPYGFGLQLWGANHDTVVIDNTIVGSGHSSIIVGGPGAGVYNITITNNVLHGGSWGVQMDTTCPTGPITIERNLMHAYKEGAIESGCGAVSAAGNILADPGFVDYAARDLRLEAGSPGLEVAVAEWSAPRDIEDHSRPQGAGPDIGAFERPLDAGA